MAAVPQWVNWELFQEAGDGVNASGMGTWKKPSHTSVLRFLEPGEGGH